MTIKEAYSFIENLKTGATKNSEIRVYTQFIDVLKKLESRELSTDEIQSIETELDRLALKSNPANRKRFFKNALRKFENYLKEAFSLTSKGYYTNMSVSFGILFGVVIGVLIGERFEKSMGISFGICMGLFIGAFIGRRMDAQAQEAGKVL